MSPSNSNTRRASRPKSLPPDPSHPDPLQTLIDQRVLAVLSDPLRYPDEMTAYLASFTSFNAVQSTSG